MGWLGNTVVTFLLLVAGFMAASSQMKSRSERIASTILEQPMITMPLVNGPWPPCVGMTGDDCVSYIQSHASSSITNIEILDDGSPVTKDLRKDRVRIFVDDDGIVTLIPDRG